MLFEVFLGSSAATLASFAHIWLQDETLKKKNDIEEITDAKEAVALYKETKEYDAPIYITTGIVALPIGGGTTTRDEQFFGKMDSIDSSVTVLDFDKTRTYNVSYLNDYAKFAEFAEKHDLKRHPHLRFPIEVRSKSIQGPVWYSPSYRVVGSNRNWVFSHILNDRAFYSHRIGLVSSLVCAVTGLMLYVDWKNGEKICPYH